MQIIPIKNLNIKKVVLQFLPFFRLKCWFKGQTISRIHLRLPNAYKLVCFDRNINGNRDIKILECDYLSVQWSMKLTLLKKEWVRMKILHSQLSQISVACLINSVYEVVVESKSLGLLVLVNLRSHFTFGFWFKYLDISGLLRNLNPQGLIT